MAIKTTEDFARSIYREHFEEASFLYEQRRYLLEDEYLDWRDLSTFEDRLEAHLDGLALGDETALALITASLPGNDAGWIYAGVRVLCQLEGFDLVRGLLANVDLQDTDQVEAWADALAAEMPETDYNPWLKKLAPELPRAIPVAVTLAGMRRLKASDGLLQLLGLKDPPDPAQLIWASGRAGDRDTVQSLLIPKLSQFMEHEDEMVISAAVLALLRMGRPRAVAACRENIARASWPLMAVGICGGRADAHLLLITPGSAQAEPELLVALGWLGNVLAVEHLLASLDTAPSAPAAALALELITGAGLKEEVFIPETPDPAELFDEELELLQGGQRQQLPEGEPGNVVTRTIRDRQTWQAWWHQNKSNFHSDARYRFGRPVTPAGLLEDILCCRHSRRARQMAIEELSIRYAIDLGIETRMFVHRQFRMAAQAEENVAVVNHRCDQGQWYFAGKIIGDS